MRKVLLVSLALAATFANAQFTRGNLVVAIVGDGDANTVGNMPVFLREYTTAGVQVGSDLSLSNLSGRNLTVTYGETSEASLELSADRRFLMLAGYDLPSRDSAFDILLSPRVIGRVGVDKSITLSNTFVPDFGDGMRSVFSTDGDTYWVTGGDAGLLSGTFAGTPSQLFDPIVSTRCVHAYRAGELLIGGSNVFNGSNGYGIWDGTTLTPIVAAGASSRDLHVINESSFYGAASTDARGMAKFVRDGNGVWSIAYFANWGFGINSLAVDGTTIYGSRSGGSAIVKIEDTGTGFTTPVTIATAPANTRFRGLSWAPVNPVETIIPSSYTVTRGVEIGSNDVTKIQTNDDVFAVAQQRFQASPALANAEVQSSFQVGSGASSVDLTVWVASNALPLNDSSCRQEVAFRNVQTGLFEVVDSRKPTSTKQEVKVTLTPQQVQNFVNGSGQATVLVRVFHLTPLAGGWTMRVDQMKLDVSR